MSSINESIKQIHVNYEVDPVRISVKFGHLEEHIYENDSYLSLFSKIDVHTDKFEWLGEAETVRIPYKDEMLGYIVDGSVRNTIGVYQRAPGPVLKDEQRTDDSKYGVLDIITNSNGKLSFVEEKDGIFIILGSGGKVPIGVFLKAISDMPYDQIMKSIAYMPKELRNSFPPIIKEKEKLSKLAVMQSGTKEPSLEECVDAVYTAMLSQTKRDSVNKSSTTFYYKYNRIKTYLNNLNYKNKDNIEAKLSVGHRAVGSQLVDGISLPVFDADGNVTVFSIPKDTHIADKHAREIRRHDITRLRVRGDRIVTLQDESSMYFRVLGYKLGEKVGNYEEGTYIDEDVLRFLNDTELLSLRVITPNGNKTVMRNNEKVSYSDFITILNYYLTARALKVIDSSEYAISNRVIVSFENTILNTVEEVYNEIVTTLCDAENIKDIINKMRNYPSMKLKWKLSSAGNKEITQPDLTNLLARQTTERKSSALMQSAPASMQYVQDGQYGRLDSLHAPQSDKIGSVHQLTVMAKVKEGTGEILSPYEKVINGKPTGDIEYISAAKEKNKFIAEWNNPMVDTEVTARINGDITVVGRTQIDYREVSPFLDMSLSRSLVPFPDYSQPKRSLMATTHQCQAVPLLYPERARVTTGADTEVPCMYYTARDLLAMYGIKETKEDSLKIIKVNWTKNSANYRLAYGSNFFVHRNPCVVSDKETLYMYRLNVKPNYTYAMDDIVFYYFSTDIREIETWELSEQGIMPFVKNPKKPAIALGKNLRVGYKTAESSTIEDAVLISRRLVTDDTLTSIQIFKYEYKLKGDEKFMTYNSVAKLHSWVSSDSSVINVMKSNGNVREINAFISGEVIYAEQTEDEAIVYVASYHRAEVGDKVAGRYGNKSVIAKIVDEEMMPYDPQTGETLDMCLSPLGLPSRMNYGQLLEVAIGAVMEKEGNVAVITPYYPNSKEIIMDKCTEYGLVPKRLYLPHCNKYTERPVMTGIMYILKLEQIANLKASAVGYPVAVDPVFGQPTSSDNEDKGQKIGEMETWALGACGMYHLLDDFFTLYVDDAQLRSKYFAALNDGPDGPWNELKENIKSTRSPARNSLVVQSIIRSFGLDIEACGNQYRILPMDMRKIATTVTKNTLLQHNDSQWTKIDLQSPVVSPYWLEKMPTMNRILGVPSVTAIIDEKDYVNMASFECVKAKDLPETTKNGYITGIDAIVYLLQNQHIDDAITRLSASMKRMEESGPKEHLSVDDAVIAKNQFVKIKQTKEFLVFLRDRGYDLDIFVLNSYPVLPSIFRQSTRNSNNKQVMHFFNKSLTGIMNAVYAKDIYAAIKDFIGYGAENDNTAATSISNFFLGSKSKGHGRVRDSVLSKRIGFSGRGVIVPMADASISPFFVGIPWYIAMTMYDSLLSLKFMRLSESMITEIRNTYGFDLGEKISDLTQRQWNRIIRSLWEFNFNLLREYISPNRDECEAFYSTARKYAKKFIEGNVDKNGFVKVNGEFVDPDTLPLETNVDASVVLFGRQPTLHKKSIRAFYVKLVDGWSIHIHPLVCAAYNADFDGDSMWVAACFGEAKIEALHNMLIDKDLIADKDGGFTLGLSQDICLGLYCMTTYKNNSKEIQKCDSNLYLYADLEALKTDVEYGTVKYYDVVLYRHKNGKSYLSTAGRMLVNGILPDAFLDTPFNDKHGIAETFNIASKGALCNLRFDDIVASREQPNGISCVKIDALVDYAYRNISSKETVMVCQNLYELGLAASDSYGVSISLDDISIDADVSDSMDMAQKKSNEAAMLYHLGIITNEENRTMSHSIWEETKKNAQNTIMKSIKSDNNLYYMLYSGARGNPGQIMQTVGFVGTIQKTMTEDIERPILNGYGNGLTSFDISQTLYSARIGVVSTQSGTKDTGYATRQATYSVMGDTIVEDDCGITNSLFDIDWSNDAVFINSKGEKFTAEQLFGKTVMEGDYDAFKLISKEVYLSAYVFESRVLKAILENNISSITLDDEVFTVKRKISDACRDRLLQMYSYALPYLSNDYAITEKTIEYIERYELMQVVALNDNKVLLDMTLLEEAYLPVDYDCDRSVTYRIENGVEHKVEVGFLLSMDILETSEDYYKYRALLTDGRLNLAALKYITDHHIKSISSSDTTVYFRYKVKKLFKDLVLYRLSAGLPYLDQYGTITSRTLDVIEKEQIPFIPVRTGLTCKSEVGMCSKCYGLLEKDKHFKTVGENIGIAAAQSMCEPASQMTMNVTHNAGNRKGNLVHGIQYFTSLIHGGVVAESQKASLEKYSKHDAFVQYEPLNKDIVSLVDEDGNFICRISGGEQRWSIPNGAFVGAGEIIISGVPNVQRYASKDIFFSSLKTRYLLITLYNTVFSDNGIDVLPRNFEVLSRAQTSQVYLVDPVELSPIKDTSVEIKEKTGHYMLMVSSHYDIIHKFTGIGFIGFERFNDMFSKAILYPEQNTIPSVVSNFFTGTPIGSTKIEFKPSRQKEYIHNEIHQKLHVTAPSFTDDFDQFDLFCDLKPESPMKEETKDDAVFDDFMDDYMDDQTNNQSEDKIPKERGTVEKTEVNNLKTMSF